MDSVATIRARLAAVEDRNIATLEDGLVRIEAMRVALREAAEEVVPPPETLADWHAQLDDTEQRVRATLDQARAVRQIMLLGRLHDIGGA